MMINSWKCSCGYQNSVLKSNLVIKQDARLAIPKGMFITVPCKITAISVVCQSPKCEQTQVVGVKD